MIFFGIPVSVAVEISFTVAIAIFSSVDAVAVQYIVVVVSTAVVTAAVMIVPIFVASAFADAVSK